MVKSAIADHPRNEPTATRDVASVQRFVIQITDQLATNILADQLVEVEHDVRIRDSAGGGVTVTGATQGAEVPVTTERQRNFGNCGVKQRDRNTTTAVDIEAPRSTTFVCEVPLRSGFITLSSPQPPKPTASVIWPARP